MIVITKKQEPAVDMKTSEIAYNPKTMFFSRDEFYDYIDEDKTIYRNKYLTLSEQDYIEYNKRVDSIISKRNHKLVRRILDDSEYDNFKWLDDKAEKRLNPLQSAEYDEQADLYLNTKKARQEAAQARQKAIEDDTYMGFSISEYERDASSRAITYIDSGKWKPANPIDIAGKTGFADTEKYLTIGNKAKIIWDDFNYLLTHKWVAGKPNPNRIRDLYGYYWELTQLVFHPLEPAYINDDPDDYTSAQKVGMRKYNKEMGRVYNSLQEARFDINSPLHPITVDMALLQLANNSDDYISYALEAGWVQKLGIDATKTTTYLRYGMDPYMLEHPCYNYITQNIIYLPEELPEERIPLTKIKNGLEALRAMAK